MVAIARRGLATRDDIRSGRPGDALLAALK
jgi:hypothetical protein